tara:strand:+ start:774 stop:1640 length:867 start_codon:yes stop_codon:yes gene_type:complete
MAFKSSKGRNTGKELEVYRSSDSGQAVGGGGGGSPVPFSATGGTKTTPGDGFVYHTFTPTPGTDTFSVASTSPEAVGGNYIEALVQGNGGAGGTGSNPGPQTKPSGGGGGGATGLWTIPITVAGDYPIKVCLGKTSAPGSSTLGNPTTRFTHYSDPTIYVQANGGNGGGYNGNPNSWAGQSGDGVSVVDNWTPEGAVRQFDAEAQPTSNSEVPANPFGTPFQQGKAAGGFGNAGMPANVWWGPYMGGFGPSPGLYGGGGNGTPGGSRGSSSGAGKSGIIIIRYPEAIT